MSCTDSWTDALGAVHEHPAGVQPGCPACEPVADRDHLTATGLIAMLEQAGERARDLQLWVSYDPTVPGLEWTAVLRTLGRPGERNGRGEASSLRESLTRAVHQFQEQS